MNLYLNSILHSIDVRITKLEKAQKQQRKPLTEAQYFEIGQRHWLPSNKVEQIHKEIDEAANNVKNTR